MTRLSVFIITLNEEKDIARTLESVRWADEIVIVDAKSTDATVTICKKYTDKIYIRDFKDFADQKNYALSQTTGDWVFSIDADEEVAPELKESITAVLGGSEPHSAYRVRRQSMMFGRAFRFTGTANDRPIRLWKRGSAEFFQPIHEDLRVQGSTGTLKGLLRHYTYNNLAEYMERFERYTSMEAKLLFDRKHAARMRDLTLRPLAAFLKLYLVKAGFRDGIQGFIFSVLSAYYVFIKHAKYRELLEAGKQP